MKTTIEFGGFYESIHSNHIDMMTNNYFDDTPLQDDENNFEYFDWSAIHKSYIKSYCYKLEEYIKDNYEIDIDFKNISGRFLEVTAMHSSSPTVSSKQCAAVK